MGSEGITQIPRGRLYYTLEPLYAQKNTIYTPVDNDKSGMRREEQYKEIMKKNECLGWIKIIKTLYLKKQKCLAEGRKNMARDELYLKLAEDFLFRELAVALDVEKDQVQELISKRVMES